MYNKIFSKIVTSSIWLAPMPTFRVWIYLIATMDEDGYVPMACIENLALVCNVTVEETKAAVAELEGPDPRSSDPENEGRRIERVPGGWIVMNATKYREIVTRETMKASTRERVRKHREKKRNVTKCNGVKRNETQSEAVSESKKEEEDEIIT
jgi:hypothetical protein